MLYRVTAPYVMLRQHTPQGDAQVGLHAGALVDGDAVPGDQLAHHVDNGLIEPVATPAAEQPAVDDGGGTAGQQGSLQPPAKSASKGDWVAFAVSQGANQAEAEAATKEHLAATYGA